MDFSLNDEQRTWQIKAKKFAEEEIRPISIQRDIIENPRETWDWSIIKKGSQLGFRTLAVPKEWGGAGVDYVTQALVMIEMARVDAGIAKAFSQNWKWGHLIAAVCSDDQKARFLKPFMADETYVMGRGITEPNAGCDNRIPPEDAPKSGLRLRAERDGDEWVLNGEKCFIANGSVAKVFFVDARTNPDVPVRQGTTMFIVPSDTPGFRVGKVYNKRGWRFYQNAELIFENARVPHANIVGQINGGVMKGNEETTRGGLFGDLELAAIALGVCEGACEAAMKHVKTVRQGGQLLAEQQAVQLKVHRMFMLSGALRAFVMQIAWEHDRKVHSTNTGLAMCYSTDIVQEVTRLNLDVLGGGAMKDAMAAKRACDAVIWTHLAGDSVQRMRVFRNLGKA